jgi:hypothetical protein
MLKTLLGVNFARRPALSSAASLPDSESRWSRADQLDRGGDADKADVKGAMASRLLTGR